MHFDPIGRRTLLGAGSVAAGALALGGLRRLPAQAQTLPVASAVAPLSGPLVAWIALDVNRGGLLRLVEIDRRSQPVRTIAAETLPSIPPASAGRRAHDLAVRTLAAAWGVPPESCRVEASRLVHPASGRAIAYAVWTDFA